MRKLLSSCLWFKDHKTTKHSCVVGKAASYEVMMFHDININSLAKRSVLQAHLCRQARDGACTGNSR